ncbi:MAG TPA: trigger factor [Desulfomonilia bacterium]|jgi:trigger factor
MKVEIKEISGTKKEMTVTVPKEEVQKVKNDIYREVAQEVVIKGFRKGKAPKNIIDTYYGGYIKGELTKKLVSENYDNAVREQELFVVSMPEIDNEDPKDDEDFTFTAKFDVKPEINPEKYTGFDLKKPVFEVKDEDVDTAITSLMESYSTMEDVTDENYEVQKGDYVISDISSADHEKLNWTKVTVDAGNRSFVPGAQDMVLGMKTGAEKTYETKITDNHYIEELRGKDVSLTLKVVSIKHRVMPELNDDFAKKVREDTPTVEDLKKMIRTELEKRAAEKLKGIVYSRVAAKLVEENKVEVPESMIKLQATMMVQGMAKRFASQGVKLQDVYPDTNALREETLSSAEQILKQSLLVEAIAKKLDIKVDEEDVDKELQEMANTYNMPLEDIRKGLEESGRLDEIRFQLLEGKVFDYVIENSNVTEDTAASAEGEGDAGSDSSGTN